MIVKCFVNIKQHFIINSTPEAIADNIAHMHMCYVLTLNKTQYEANCCIVLTRFKI